ALAMETEPEVETTPEPIVDEIAKAEPSVVIPAVSTQKESIEGPHSEITELDTEPVVAAVVEETNAAAKVSIVDIPSPENGVYYRVQISAGRSNVKKSDFEKLYTFNEGYNLENHEGWFKYTTGYHQVYKSARDDRQRISAKYDKFLGPFVTAYNDGERISVQEALMVSAQKWYP
ncbi:MAG: hypothetical protein AAGC47_13595, partial [Bacteroidota bacterium]